MLDIAPSELLAVAVIALLVIGPKDLPRVMRVVGQWVGKARGMARHFRSGFDNMIREAELEEMEKKWKEENERIMQAYPSTPLIENIPAASLSAGLASAGETSVETEFFPASEPSFSPDLSAAPTDMPKQAKSSKAVAEPGLPFPELGSTTPEQSR